MINTTFIPQPLSESFDAAEVFAREVYRDNPIMQGVKHWITDELQKPLDLVADIILYGHVVEFPEKGHSRNLRTRHSSPSLCCFEMIPIARVRNVNMDDYREKAEKQ